MSSEDPVGRSRRSKEAQSRETRARLVGAAIACVARSGYAGTTTAQVAHEAGLTRGALQYQFADKTDLMLAMAETLYEAQVARVSERLAGGGSFERRFGALLDAAFEMSESPAHVVFLELWMAARTDADLRARLVPLVRRMEEVIDAGFAAIFEDAPAGVGRMRELRYLTQAALRGLAIGELLGGDAGFRKRELALLRELVLAAAVSADGAAVAASRATSALAPKRPRRDRGAGSASRVRGLPPLPR